MARLIFRDSQGREGTVEITMSGRIETEDDLSAYEAAGVHRVFVRPWRRTAEAIDAIRDFADRFIEPVALDEVGEATA